MTRGDIKENTRSLDYGSNGFHRDCFEKPSVYLPRLVLQASILKAGGPQEPRGRQDIFKVWVQSL